LFAEAKKLTSLASADRLTVLCKPVLCGVHVDAVNYDHFNKAQIKVFPLFVGGTSAVAQCDHD